MNVEISIDNLLELLVFAPNLKILKLFFVHENWKPNKLKKYSSETLPLIDNLMIYECNRSMASIVEYLPENSIKSLTIKTNDIETLMLRHQPSIIKMNLTYHGESPIPVDLLANQQLTHLTVNVRNSENLLEIVSPQNSLKFLDSIGTIIDNDTFGAITKLPQLDKLMVNVSGISHSIFSAFSGMKSLKSLTLKNVSFRHLNILKHCDLMLDTVNFIDCKPEEVSMIQAVEKKFMGFKSKSC